MRINRRTQGLFPLLILLLLAGATVWLERITQREAPAAPGPVSREADFVADGITLRRYDQDGRIQYVLVAEKMRHFGEDHSSELLRPRLDFLGRPEAMRLEADTARITREGDEVELIDKVRARREAYAGKPAAELHTSRMTVWPNEEKMRTEAPVRLEQGRTVITADRMEGDNLVGELQLQGRVRGLLHRNQAPQP